MNDDRNTTDDDLLNSSLPSTSSSSSMITNTTTGRQRSVSLGGQNNNLNDQNKSLRRGNKNHLKSLKNNNRRHTISDWNDKENQEFERLEREAMNAVRENDEEDTTNTKEEGEELSTLMTTSTPSAAKQSGVIRSVKFNRGGLNLMRRLSVGNYNNNSTKKSHTQETNEKEKEEDEEENGDETVNISLLAALTQNDSDDSDDEEESLLVSPVQSPPRRRNDDNNVAAAKIMDSPARNTRLATRRLSNHISSPAATSASPPQKSPLRKSPAKNNKKKKQNPAIPDSPARNTRSRTKASPSPSNKNTNNNKNKRRETADTQDLQGFLLNFDNDDNDVDDDDSRRSSDASSLPSIKFGIDNDDDDDDDTRMSNASVSSCSSANHKLDNNNDEDTDNNGDTVNTALLNAVLEGTGLERRPDTDTTLNSNSNSTNQETSERERRRRSSIIIGGGKSRRESYLADPTTADTIDTHVLNGILDDNSSSNDNVEDASDESVMETIAEGTASQENNASFASAAVNNDVEEEDEAMEDEVEMEEEEQQGSNLETNVEEQVPKDDYDNHHHISAEVEADNKLKPPLQSSRPPQIQIKTKTKANTKKRTVQFAAMTPSSSSSTPLSALKKPRYSRVTPHAKTRPESSNNNNGGALKVAFGSPVYAEYNKNSPSMSLTPLPKQKFFPPPDSASPLNRDDNDDVEESASSPETMHLMAPSSSSSPLNSSTSSIEQDNDDDEDATMELEENITELLQQNYNYAVTNDGSSIMNLSMASSSGSDASNISTAAVASPTMQLESNLTALLQQADDTAVENDGDDSFNRSSLSTTDTPLNKASSSSSSADYDDHHNNGSNVIVNVNASPTMQLESNLTALLQQADDNDNENENDDSISIGMNTTLSTSTSTAMQKPPAALRQRLPARGDDDDTNESGVSMEDQNEANEDTMELEGNITQVLAAVNANSSFSSTNNYDNCEELFTSPNTCDAESLASAANGIPSTSGGSEDGSAEKAVRMPSGKLNFDTVATTTTTYNAATLVTTEQHPSLRFHMKKTQQQQQLEEEDVTMELDTDLSVILKAGEDGATNTIDSAQLAALMEEEEDDEQEQREEDAANETKRSSSTVTSKQQDHDNTNGADEHEDENENLTEQSILGLYPVHDTTILEEDDEDDNASSTTSDLIITQSPTPEKKQPGTTRLSLGAASAIKTKASARRISLSGSASAAGNPPSSENQQDDGDNNARTRRKSTSSITFHDPSKEEHQPSIPTRSSASFYKDHEDNNVAVTAFDDSQATVEMKDEATTVPMISSEPTITSKEVGQIVMNILEEQQYSSKSSDENDALAEAFVYGMKMLPTPMESSTTASTRQSLLEFMSAVVSEVEGKYKYEHNEDDGGAFENYQFLIDSMDMEHKIRTKDPEFVQLVRDVQLFAESEWLEWEQQVMESLGDVIAGGDGYGDTCTADHIQNTVHENAIESGEQLVREIQDTIALIESKASRMARRTSLKRRNQSMMQLANEVDELERQIAALEFEHTNAMVDMSKMNMLVVQMDGLNIESENLIKCRTSAEENRRDYKMLEGLLSFSPLSLEESKIQLFLHMGSTCICQDKYNMEVSFDLSDMNTNKLGCAIPMDVHVHVRSSREKNTCSSTCSEGALLQVSSGLQSFLDQKTKDIRNAFSSQRKLFNDPSEIKSMLHALQWQIGRMELIAGELRTIQLKYETILESQVAVHEQSQMMIITNDDDASQSGFALTIDFTSKSMAAKLRVCFDINDSYPFSPMDVCMDTIIGHDCVDVDALGRQLMKNATPGFAYLSRACDVIVAYLQ